jgi:inner membrane protein COX18
MSSARLLRPPAFRLPARSTSAHFHLPSRRAFHATRPRNDAVLDTILVLPHELLSQLHTALPWYAAIPLTAFIVRGILVTTAGSWSRALTARYVGLHPLRQAIAYQKRHELMKKGGFKDPREAKTIISRAISAETRALDERWNCTLRGQMSWTLAQLPIFMMMAETIRQMAGARDGLLGLVLSGVGLRESAGSIHGVSEALNPWFEASLADEGMLWFTNLLVPDPTGTLPYVVSALMFTNVLLSKNGATDPENVSKTSKWIRRLLLGTSLTIGPICQQLPAAMLLYWTASTLSVMLWNVWLDRKYPAVKDGIACKRPLKIIPPPPPKVPLLRPRRA